MRLILASSSPQRQALLRDAGYDFEVQPPDPNAECGVCSGESPPELVARLAFQKAEDVAARTQAGLIVACDTVAECQGQVLGKPHDENHAREMLNLLRGREHRVFSGLCLLPPGGEPNVQVATTVLQMEPLTDAEIDEYLDTGLWEGKAGGFGYQDRLGWLTVASGSESNVIGLPMELLAEMLTEYDS